MSWKKLVVFFFVTEENTIGIIILKTKTSQPVPRHAEINDYLAKHIINILKNKP